MITGGVIDYAESLPICFRTISVNERTSQTPSTLNYGTGYIEKSGETDIVIILHNVVTKETYTKRRSNIGWGDWETYALKSDLDKVAKIDRSTSSAWVGDNDNNMIFNCNFNNKTLTVTFTDGKTVIFQGK